MGYLRIKVPATSANMGPGFDSIGIALKLHNVVHIAPSETLEISCISGHKTRNTEQNLIYRSMAKVYELRGKALKGIKIVEQCNIPMTRGLGSSSACVVAGILGANELLGNPLSQEEMINLAASIEGHPDNSTPAIRGGFVAALLEEGRVYQVRVPILGKLSFCVFVPDFELKTDKARSILPEYVSRRDAVFNLSRAALLAGSLVAGEFQNIGVATDDRLHQPYRYDLIPGGRDIVKSALELGALGAYISGAGPSIIAIIRGEDTEFYGRAREIFSKRYPNWNLLMLDCDEVGATVERVDDITM